MTLDISVQIEGLDDLSQQLAQLVSIAKQQQYVLNACSYAMTPILKEVKRLAPVAEQDYFRHIRGHKVEVKPGGLKKAIIRKRVKLDNSKGVAIQIKYGKAFYWRFLEYGTPRMLAVPFVRPAFDAKKAEALERFKEKYRSYVNDVIQRQSINTDGEGDASD